MGERSSDREGATTLLEKASYRGAGGDAFKARRGATGTGPKRAMEWVTGAVSKDSMVSRD